MARTGGTNLAEHLLLLTSFKQVLHEPFNRGRVFGSLLEEQPFDTVQMRDKVANLFVTPRFIKYCVDAIPSRMARMLLQATLSLPVAHLFLYRQDAQARLLSKWFAMNTGLWSADLARFKHITGANEVDTQRSLGQINPDFYHIELPVEELVAHERFQRGLLSDIYQALQEHRAPVACLSFEDLYSGNVSVAKRQIVHALQMLNGMGIVAIPDDEGIDNWLMNLRAEGDQAMRAYYQNFSNLDDLKQAVLAIPPFLGQLNH